MVGSASRSPKQNSRYYAPTVHHPQGESDDHRVIQLSAEVAVRRLSIVVLPWRPAVGDKRGLTNGKGFPRSMLY